MNLTRLDWIKEILGIAPGDTSKDAALRRLICEASDFVARYTQRHFGEVDVREYIDGNGRHELPLKRTPVNSVVMVRTGKAQALAFTPNPSFGTPFWSINAKGITLSHFDANGDVQETRLDWYAHGTTQALATAMSAAGWQATVKSNQPARLLLPGKGEGAGMACFAPDPVDADLPPDSERYLRNCGGCFPDGCRTVFVWYKAGWKLPVEGEPEGATTHTLPCSLIGVVNDVIATIWQASQATGAGSAAAASGASMLAVFCESVEIDDYSESNDARAIAAWAGMASRGVAGLLSDRKELLQRFKLKSLSGSLLMEDDCCACDSCVCLSSYVQPVTQGPGGIGGDCIMKTQTFKGLGTYTPGPGGAVLQIPKSTSYSFSPTNPAIPFGVQSASMGAPVTWPGWKGFNQDNLNQFGVCYEPVTIYVPQGQQVLIEVDEVTP